MKRTWQPKLDEIFYFISYNNFGISYTKEMYYEENDYCRKIKQCNPIFKTLVEANAYLREIREIRKKYKVSNHV